ncbi:uncharacterized protein LOC135165394 [Diachasmimorpha longicaudata]|uniref:uncharacterized protein LOC135165394 n=1 Tax=Diachasmimorpha longicaudata TaxID=58733 RepID=UPI0030B8C34B
MTAFLVAVQILYLTSQTFAEDDSYLQIPKGFSIGAATSAYQVEGAWNVSDKSESVWDRRIHTNISYYGNGDSGDVAADSYHKYKEDVQIIKRIGLDHYRFSISWSRVLPTGFPDKVSKDGIQYYKNLIDELLAHGIVPFVTIFHFDDVQSLAEKTGGWTNESMVEYFGDYARVIFRELGPKVKFWTTINELNIYCEENFYVNESEPNTAYTIRYSCIHNLLKGHARAYHIYNDEFRATQGGQVGIIVHGSHHLPVSANDTTSEKIAFDFETGWIMHPIFSKEGDYPEVMKTRIAENSKAEGLPSSRLPEFSPEWVQYIKGTSDYLGLNHYVSYMVEPAPKSDGRWYDDTGLKKTDNPKWNYTISGFPIFPKGIGAVLREIKLSYNNPPVYILENGMATRSGINDTDRISFLYSFMKEVLLAIRDGCNVRSYTIWSLFDNFEWYVGYSQPFGIVHVDFKDPNRTRTLKLSSHWLAKVLEERKLIPYKDMVANPKNGSGSLHGKNALYRLEVLFTLAVVFTLRRILVSRNKFTFSPIYFPVLIMIFFLIWLMVFFRFAPRNFTQKFHSGGSGRCIRLITTDIFNLTRVEDKEIFGIEFTVSVSQVLKSTRVILYNGSRSFVLVLQMSPTLHEQIFAGHAGHFAIPEGLSIGAATSAYQIEGAWNVSDKSESIWDRRTHTNPSHYNGGDNGDVAADSYHKYKEDVQILKNIGVNHYRFSISWSRILPSGTPNIISQDGVQYYNNLIDELLANGIVPYVTMLHFDDVQSLIEKTGGWTNESMVEHFADYARVLFNQLGSKVKFWSTINELDVYCMYIFFTNETEANTAYSARYSCVHNLLKAHARAYHIYNEEFRPTQGGQVGLIMSGVNHIPISSDDLESAKIGFDFDIGWIMHPIFSMEGDYPPVMRLRVAENSKAEGLTKSRLPEFSADWVNYIKGSADYLGLNHYVSYMVEPTPKINGRWYDDSGLIKTDHPHWQFTTNGFSIVPEGIGAVLRQIRDAFDNPPVHILENGMAGSSELDDADRISYLYSFMKEVFLAVHDGCDVRSYTVWSLLDNFEWVDGYSQRFGLVHVDFNDPDRPRTPKRSSLWLKKVIKEGRLIPFVDTSFDCENNQNFTKINQLYCQSDYPQSQHCFAFP